MRSALRAATFHLGDPSGAARMIEKANLAEKLRLFSDHFAPGTVSRFNGHDVVVAKLKGPFAWHRHDDTDDFFLVLKGTLDIELRDRTLTLAAGEAFFVPKGMGAPAGGAGEVHLLLIEPTGTPNTGDAGTAAGRQAV